MSRPLFDPRGRDGKDDYQNFWERLGLDDGGLPVHFPMGVDRRGRGPESPKPHHYICWCGHPDCPLTQALQDARVSALASVRIGWSAS